MRVNCTYCKGKLRDTLLLHTAAIEIVNLSVTYSNGESQYFGFDRLYRRLYNSVNILSDESTIWIMIPI